MRANHVSVSIELQFSEDVDRYKLHTMQHVSCISASIIIKIQCDENLSRLIVSFSVLIEFIEIHSILTALILFYIQ